MNILEHILAGHYPVDGKGRALVPVGCDKVATVCATDAPGCKPILGFIRSDDPMYQAQWCAWDEHGNNCPSQPRSCWVDLLPPPPRKVLVKAYVIIYPDGSRYYSQECYPNPRPDWRVVELTGSYEEEWPA